MNSLALEQIDYFVTINQLHNERDLIFYVFSRSTTITQCNQGACT